MVCRDSPLRYTGGERVIYTGQAVVCRDSPLRYTQRLMHPMPRMLWFVGTPRSGILESRSLARLTSLWFVGTPRSGILRRATLRPYWMLWFVGTPRSGILFPVYYARLCGAVVCRDSPLRYTRKAFVKVEVHAVVCRDSPLRYTHAASPRYLPSAVVCRDSPLRYTVGCITPYAVWGYGMERHQKSCIWSGAFSVDCFLFPM